MKLLRSIGVIWLVAIFWLSTDVAGANDRQPHGLAAEGVVMPALQVLEDRLQVLDEHSVQTQPMGHWQTLTHETPSFGFTRSVYWVRFSYRNLSERTIPLYVEVGYPLLTEVTFYHRNVFGIASTDTLGNSLPFDQRRVEHRNFVFPVSLAPHSENSFYLRIRSDGAMQFPITLWTPERFHAQDQYSIFQHGAYYGLVFVMALYSLFLFWQIRDKVYLLYVMYVSTFAVTQMALSGFANQMLWPDFPWWGQRSVAVLASATVLFGSLFVRFALKLQDHAVHLCRLINGLSLLGLVFLVASVLFPYHTMIQLAAALVAFACGTSLYASYYVWLRRQQRFAAYFSFACTAFLFGVLCLALSKFGVMPRSFLTESAAQIGSAIEIILSSYALAERLRAAQWARLQAETEALAANEKLLGMQQDITSDLERKYFLKTRELEDALEKVQVLNAELTEMSHTDQLTGVRNRRFMDVFLAREVRRAQRYNQPLSLIMIDIDHFKQVNDDYGHPIGDLCLKRVTQVIMSSLRRSQDEVCRYGGEEIAVILPDTTLQGAFIRAEVIRRAVENMVVDTGDTQVRVTVSLGVGSTEKLTGCDPVALTTRADKALYTAKRMGRNRTCSHVFEMADAYANVHWLHKKTD